MSEETRTEPAQGRQGKDLVVASLVSFLKASYIYPANNRRVLDAAHDLIDSVESESGRSGTLTTHVVGEEIRVDGIGVELPETLNVWLREAFCKAGLAGLELKTGLRQETLAEFATRLREAGRTGCENFTDDWPAELSDLNPLDLLFRGFHRADGEGWEEDADTTEILSSGGPLLTEPLAPDSEQSKLAERIMENEEIRTRLVGIEERWSGSLSEDTDAARVDLVAEIARLLPAEAMRSDDRAYRLVHDILDILEAYRPGDEDEEKEFVDLNVQNLHGLALNVAKRFFDVQVPRTDRPDTKDLPAGRPGDEVVVDDLDSLIEEYQGLPDATGISFPTDDESLSGELVGIYLHRLLSDPEGEQAPRLRLMLSELLDDLTDDKVAVLRSYLEPCLTGNMEAARQSPEWKVLDMLRDQGRLGVLRRAGLLHADLAAELFPELFEIFLDTLSPDDMDDRKRLARAVTLIGPERIRKATAELADEDRILTPERIRMVLSVESQEIVPLVGILAEHGDIEVRSDIALLLRKLEPPRPESAALRAVNPPELLPSGYLRDLCQFYWGGESEKLRQYSLFLLRKYITDIAGDSSLVEMRIYAIRALMFLPGEETAAFLKEISLKGRLLGVSKAARLVRQAAARTLEEIEDV